MANYCLLFRICFVNCSSSENELVFGLDKPEVCKHNRPETLGLIRAAGSGSGQGLAETGGRGPVLQGSETTSVSVGKSQLNTTEL